MSRSRRVPGTRARDYLAPLGILRAASGKPEGAGGTIGDSMACEGDLYARLWHPVLLAALNTGHAGGCGTLHANSAADVPARVEALAQAAGLPRDAAHSQLASALDVVIHLGRDHEWRRRVREISVPARGADGLVRLQRAASFTVDGLERGPAAPVLAQRITERLA